MRNVLALLFGVTILGLVGCDSVESLPTRVRERFEAPQPKIRVYTSEQRPVFDAALRAVKTIGFVVGRSGAAQGIVKAHSPLRASDGFGKARQHAIEVKVESFEPGKTQVSVLLREQEESESFAGATDIPLREHGLYESYFAALEAGLGLKGEAVSGPQG